MVTLDLAGVEISSWWLNVLVKISYSNVLNLFEAGTYSSSKRMVALFKVCAPSPRKHVTYCLLPVCAGHLQSVVDTLKAGKIQIKEVMC